MPTAEKQKIKPVIMLNQPTIRKAETTWNYRTTTMVPEMARYYGFSPLERIPKLEKQDERLANEFDNRVGALFSVAEKIAIVRRHFARGTTAQPVALFSEKMTGRGQNVHAEYHLDIIGTAEPMAETLLIKLCYEIAREYSATAHSLQTPSNTPEIVLEINSVGERESFSRFSRDTAAHFHRHLNELHPACRQDFKKSTFAPVNCEHEECRLIRTTMPESVGFLSEPSRHHFMHVLEYLEAAKTPFAFDKELIVEPDIVQHTIFRITLDQSVTAESPTTTSTTSAPLILARGARWGGLARRMGFKKDILGTSAIVRIPLKKTTRETQEKKMSAPQFYFIHIGYDALLKSLIVIETLRRAKIAIYHALLKDTMTTQLSNAEYLGVPYILIMGQKESVDGTVLVRHMRTRSQETVPLNRLVDYLRRVAKKL